MGMKARINHRTKITLDPILQAKATEAIEAAACYLQEETKLNNEYRFTDAEAISIIRRTANRMSATTR